MAQIVVRPFVGGLKGAQVRLTVQARAAGLCAYVGLNAAMQRQAFGRLLDPDKDRLAMLLDDSPGRRHLLGLTLSRGEGALPVRRFTHGSVRVACLPWFAPRKGACTLPLVAVREAGVVCELPEWAQPPAGRGREAGA